MIRKGPIAAALAASAGVIWAAASTVVLAAGTDSATDARSGEALYTRHCMDCHAQMTGGDGSALLSRSDSLVENRQALSQRVEYCQRGLGLGWPDADIAKVADYLNRNYYHFKQ